MNIVQIIVGVLLAGGVAFFLNTVLANRVEKSYYKIALKIFTYCICFVLAGFFIFFGSLRTILDNFLDEKISFVESKLNVIYPNLLETQVDITELTPVLNNLSQAIETESSSEHGFPENVILRVFQEKLSNYINMAKNNTAKLATIADDEGKATIKTILVNIKEQSLDAVYPYFIIGQIATIMLLFIYIGIYVGIIVFLKKGGGLYNKSIVFGEGATDVERGMNDRPI